MKRLALAITLAVAGVASVAAPFSAAEARPRERVVYVNDVDVYWRHGRPYYRVTREPVYLVRNYRGGPRYYYRTTYTAPRYEYRRYNAWRDRDYDRRYYDDDGTRVRITYDSDYDRP
jgi:hypothetical protein